MGRTSLSNIFLKTLDSSGTNLEENVIKNSTVYPSGPGVLPDFIFLMALPISDDVMSVSNIFLSETSKVGSVRSLKKFSTQVASLASEVYNFS